MPEPKTQPSQDDLTDEALSLFLRRSTEARTQRLVRKRLKCGALRALQDLDVPQPPDPEPAT